MAFTATDLASIESAIASGVKKCVINGREVMYQDIAQMREARKDIIASISANTIPRNPRVSYGSIARR